ncbi:hypothetical protein IWZ03DRAFT_192890 [Phyllosticta citriasiana]|uniref:Transmembrane protein n=1 Tax=Phyllosticta citriasiana TaxID=595635 RepID=A0ABR1KNS0_9PEZI
MLQTQSLSQSVMPSPSPVLPSRRRRHSFPLLLLGRWCSGRGRFVSFQNRPVSSYLLPSVVCRLPSRLSRRFSNCFVAMLFPSVSHARRKESLSQGYLADADGNVSEAGTKQNKSDDADVFARTFVSVYGDCSSVGRGCCDNVIVAVTVTAMAAVMHVGKAWGAVGCDTTRRGDKTRTRKRGGGRGGLDRKKRGCVFRGCLTGACWV